jgi:hypothetical protein
LLLKNTFVRNYYSQSIKPDDMKKINIRSLCFQINSLFLMRRMTVDDKASQ